MANYSMKHRVQEEEIAEALAPLLTEYSASDILDVLIEECPAKEMDSLVSTMETELKYRSKYKMIKVETLDQEIKLEEFLDQLYPMYTDRSQVTLL